MRRKSWLSVPYVLWAVLFTLVPLLIIILYSITENDASGGLNFRFTLQNYRNFFTPIYLGVLWSSVKLSVYSTVLCLLIGYPMAYIISRAPQKRQNVMVMFILLPLWTNFLLRTYAWQAILRDQGVLNQILLGIGLIHQPLQLLNTDAAVIMGMVYNFLPFMILPLYTVLSKMDPNLLEAASDLGASRQNVFKKVIFPLSLPGIASGVIMVFMPAISTFVISDLLGGGHRMLLGNVIEKQFREARNWQFGSAISMILMLIILVSMIFLNKFSNQESGEKPW